MVLNENQKEKIKITPKNAMKYRKNIKKIKKI